MATFLSFLVSVLQSSSLGEVKCVKNFVFQRLSHVLLWACAPLALYGYILTSDILLYQTFIGLIFVSLVASFIAFIIISREKTKELKVAYSSLNKTINNVVEQVSELIGAFLIGDDEEDELEQIKPKIKKKTKKKKKK